MFDQHVLTTLGQTVVHVRTCMNSMSFSEGEVFIQTTNLIHTLPLLIVSIELVYCLGINLKKKSFYDLTSQFYKGKKNHKW